MYSLLAIVVIFVLLILMVVWGHYFGQNRLKNTVDNEFRDETNIRLYHEHKAEIEKDYQQGNIDDENYQYLLNELNQSLLQDINENKQEAHTDKVVTGKLNIVWPVVISVFILGFTGYFYQQHGAYQQIANVPQQKPEPARVEQQQRAINQANKFAQLVKQQPENSNAWYQYGEALVSVGEFANAVAAFQKVMDIEGEQADVYGAQAQATYYLNKQQITPQVQTYIDKALAIDALDPSTNILLGMNHFMGKQYKLAIEYWQKVVKDGRPTVNVEALKGAIAEANNRLALTGEQVEVDLNTGPQLTLQVSVSEALQAKLEGAENKTVFVYAVPTTGQRIPVAAVKLMANDLPTQVVLNDARAMAPQMKLSNVEKVHVYAVISESGSAGIRAGDYTAEAENVDVSTLTPISLVIDSVIEEKNRKGN